MERIIEEAGAVYRKYGSGDVAYLAEKLGVEVHEELNARNVKEVYFPDLQAVVISPGLPRHERNYLLAHGLGHHLFHRTGTERTGASFREELACGNVVMGQMGASRTEREADLFAGYLLVPETRLKAMLGQTWLDEANDPVLKLALEFQVPVELMRERLIFEGLRSRPIRQGPITEN
jgi:Zn-dependent peptidase ImmA (M78 family)